MEEGGTPWPLEVVRKIKAALAAGGFWYWLLLQDLAFWSPLAIQLCLGGEGVKKEEEQDSFHRAEAIAFHSDPLSHHCCWHPVLPALLPA